MMKNIKSNNLFTSERNRYKTDSFGITGKLWPHPHQTIHASIITNNTFIAKPQIGTHKQTDRKNTEKIFTCIKKKDYNTFYKDKQHLQDWFEICCVVSSIVNKKWKEMSATYESCLPGRSCLFMPQSYNIVKCKNNLKAIFSLNSFGKLKLFTWTEVSEL